MGFPIVHEDRTNLSFQRTTCIQVIHVNIILRIFVCTAPMGIVTNHVDDLHERTLMHQNRFKGYHLNHVDEHSRARQNCLHVD